MSCVLVAAAQQSSILFPLEGEARLHAFTRAKTKKNAPACPPKAKSPRKMAIAWIWMQHE